MGDKNLNGYSYLQIGGETEDMIYEPYGTYIDKETEIFVFLRFDGENYFVEYQLFIDDGKLLSGDDYTGEEDASEFVIAKRKRFQVKPMSPEEAVLQMNLLGHNFFVFKNNNTDEMNVVYKRNDGNYALIESI